MKEPRRADCWQRVAPQKARHQDQDQQQQQQEPELQVEALQQQQQQLEGWQPVDQDQHGQQSGKEEHH